MIDDALLQEIRDRNNIVSVVGDYVSLRKAGSRYMGLCPFHQERTPSFSVQESEQFFYCFGCQTGGDVISFVRELNGYSFIEAVRHLADRAGIRLPEPKKGYGGPDARERRVQRALKDHCYAIGKLAQSFYVARLDSLEGHACRDYLQGRGIHHDAIARFGLGFAPDRWDGLLEELRRGREDLRIAEQIGLIVPRRSGDGHYDRFRNRLMFPIRSISGDVIAFSGRTLSSDAETAKYINSPETPVYVKGSALFGIHEARQAMRKAGHAVVVEGNLDLVRLAQEGIEQVVAPLGTALTEAQCRIIRRFVPRAVLLYDGDNAGRAATVKAIPIALAAGLEPAVALLPPGEDPDSFVGKEGIDALRVLLDGASPGWEYLVEHTLTETRARESLKGKVAAVDRLAPVLTTVADRREQSLYRSHLAQSLELTERRLGELLRETRPSRRPRAGAEEPRRTRPAPTLELPEAEQKLLILMLRAPRCSPLFLARQVGDLFTHGDARRAAEALAERYELDGRLEPGPFVESLEDPALRRTLYSALSASGSGSGLVADWQEEFSKLVSVLRKRHLARRRSELQAQIGAALARGDVEEHKRLMALYQQQERERETGDGARE